VDVRDNKEIAEPIILSTVNKAQYTHLEFIGKGP